MEVSVGSVGFEVDVEVLALSEVVCDGIEGEVDDGNICLVGSLDIKFSGEESAVASFLPSSEVAVTSMLR